MTDLRKAAEIALEFVEWLYGDDHSVKPKNSGLETREALRQALAQPEQEPAAWISKAWNEPTFLIAPPKREWVGLTDEEIIDLGADNKIDIAWAYEIEAKIKEKNT